MNKRMLNIKEAAEYIGLGKTKALTELKKMNAQRRFGRRVVYDVLVIDKYLNGKEE